MTAMHWSLAFPVDFASYRERRTNVYVPSSELSMSKPSIAIAQYPSFPSCSKYALQFFSTAVSASLKYSFLNFLGILSLQWTGLSSNMTCPYEVVKLGCVGGLILSVPYFLSSLHDCDRRRAAEFNTFLQRMTHLCHEVLHSSLATAIGVCTFNPVSRDLTWVMVASLAGPLVLCAILCISLAAVIGSVSAAMKVRRWICDY